MNPKHDPKIFLYISLHLRSKSKLKIMCIKSDCYDCNANTYIFVFCVLNVFFWESLYFYWSSSSHGCQRFFIWDRIFMSINQNKKEAQYKKWEKETRVCEDIRISCSECDLEMAKRCSRVKETEIHFHLFHCLFLMRP